jgi:hypothetical protein
MGCWWKRWNSGSGIAREHYVKLLPSRSIFPEPTNFENRCNVGREVISALYTLSETELSVWHHAWQKNGVNCAVLTGNSSGLRTVLSSRLSHRELHSSLRESHSFLSLPADTTMTSSQRIQPSKMNKRKATLAFIEVCRSLPCYYPPVTRTRRHTELTKLQP